MANWVNIMDIFYPVGSIYLSTNSTSPASIVGGSWTQVKGGCLAATGYTGYASAGEFGGYFNIAESNLPAHAHYALNSNHTMTFSMIESISGVSGKLPVGTAGRYGFASNESYDHLRTASQTGSTGGGQAFYPRHYALYVWKRTA